MVFPFRNGSSRHGFPAADVLPTGRTILGATAFYATTNRTCGEERPHSGRRHADAAPRIRHAEAPRANRPPHVGNSGMQTTHILRGRRLPHKRGARPRVEKYVSWLSVQRRQNLPAETGRSLRLCIRRLNHYSVIRSLPIRPLPGHRSLHRLRKQMNLHIHLLQNRRLHIENRKCPSDSPCCPSKRQ